MEPINRNEIPCGYDPIRDEWEAINATREAEDRAKIERLTAGGISPNIIAKLGIGEHGPSLADAADEWWNGLNKKEQAFLIQGWFAVRNPNQPI